MKSLCPGNLFGKVMKAVSWESGKFGRKEGRNKEGRAVFFPSSLAVPWHGITTRERRSEIGACILCRWAAQQGLKLNNLTSDKTKPSITGFSVDIST